MMKMDQSCWNKKDSKYTRELQDGRQKIKGQYTDNYALSQFSLTEQKCGVYNYRGTVSILSHRTHSVLNQRLLSDKKVSKSIYVKLDQDEKDIDAVIKGRIVEGYQDLLITYRDEIHRDLVNETGDNMNLFQLVTLYGREFLLNEKQIKDVGEQEERKMLRAAAQINNLPLREVSCSALEKARRSLGVSYDRTFVLLYEFVQYLITQCRYEGGNPFDLYYQKNPTRTPRSAENEIAKLDKAHSLTQEERDRLEESIATADAENKKITGLLLIYGAGLTVDLALKCRWKQLRFDQIKPYRSCQIYLYRSQGAGATHDYTRPVCPFAAQELRRRYEAAAENSAAFLEKQILEGVTEKQLKDFCRTHMEHLSVRYDKIYASKSSGGVSLLLDDYKYRLFDGCKMKKESDLAFMRMRSINNDVTVDSYASLTSDSGQKRLQTKLNRCQSSSCKREPSRIRCGYPDEEKKEYAIPPKYPQSTTAVRAIVHVKAGDVFYIYSDEGIKGRVTRRKQDASKEVQEEPVNQLCCFSKNTEE